MATEKIIILAVDPGTREIGVAVLSDGELLYYGVKTVKRRTSASEILSQVRRIISRLIADHNPRYLAIEKMFLIHKSAALLNVAADEMKAVAKAQRLQIYEYSPALVRKIICRTGRATKSEAARVIATIYPELARYLEQRTRWEELYYANMFDAVAVGVVANMEISGETPADSNKERK